MTDQDATARGPSSRPPWPPPTRSTAPSDSRRRTRPCVCVTLRDHLAVRASDHPDEFGTDGSVKAKSEAARLDRDLRAAEHPPVPWQRREQDAANRVANARRAADRFTADNIEDLILDLKPGREADDALIIEKLNELDAMLVDRISFAQKVAGLLAPVSGLDAVTEVPSADDIAELRKTIRNFLAAGLRPTLPVSIVTPEGTTPPRVKTAAVDRCPARS